MKDFKRSTVYQIYPKSFYDSDGDGIGDIKGITAKLDYLKELGVDYIWSTPFFVSPQNDNGYDVADYYEIQPGYGTMEDVEELIAEADKRGMGLMFDMVFNHTSTEHEWFKKAMAGDPYYKDFYIFRDGRDAEESREGNGAQAGKDVQEGNAPTNWVSKFGGNAWEYVPQWNQYYLHLFDKTQADLNWENPNVRRELVKILKFWIEKGVKGFRFDVINLISKPDVMVDDLEGDGRRFYTDGAKVHQYLKEICRESGITEKHLVTVGEMSSTTLENCVGYTNPAEEELSMCFSFHHLKVDYKNQNKWELQPFDFQQLKSILNHWQLGMEEQDGWNALFWNNHDQPRALSRFCGNEAYREQAGKMLAGCIHLMRGTPYIYQGEEIGMTNAGFTDIIQYRDVESLNYYRILKEQGKSEEETLEILRQRSRDNGRTPMLWDASHEAGFTNATPWIQINRDYEEHNAETEMAEENSIWHFYQKLVAIRKELDVISEGSYRPMLEDHPQVFAYERKLGEESLVAFYNFYDVETQVEVRGMDIQNYECILTNYEKRELTDGMTLKPYEAVVFYRA